MISYGDPTSANSSVNRTIKSYVMRKYREEKRKRQKRLPSIKRPDYRSVISQLQGQKDKRYRPHSASSDAWAENSHSILGIPLPSHLNDTPKDIYRPFDPSGCHELGLGFTSESDELQFSFPDNRILQTAPSSSLDPFNALCIPASPRMFLLLQYSKPYFKRPLTIHFIKCLNI